MIKKYFPVASTDSGWKLSEKGWYGYPLVSTEFEGRSLNGQGEVWVRIPNFLPPASIASVKLGMWAEATATSPPVALRVYGDDQANPTYPTSCADYDGRTKTTNYADWSIAAGTGWIEVDITDVINELLASYSYDGTTAIQLLIKNNVPTATHYADLVSVYLKINGSAVAHIHKFTINSTAHNNYGLAYPVTYAFSIPAALTNAKAYHMHTGGGWNQFTAKTTDDFFNGIECVRWDYVNHKAYVSVAFDETADDIFIKITDANGVIQPTEFLEVPMYYDNRICAVTNTNDELTLTENDDWWKTDKMMIDACQSRSIWATLACVTQVWTGNWGVVQTELDEGFLEVASHSRTHPHPTFSSSEVAGSRDDIKSNLVLPSPYKKGSSEYVPAWLSPYNELDAASRTTIANAKYLGIRSWQVYPVSRIFGGWYNADGVHTEEKMNDSMSTGYEVSTLAQLNAEFNICYNAGGIYLLHGHPYYEWQNDHNSFSSGKMAQHLDYIKGRKDVWYVGFGAMYMYHYVGDRQPWTWEGPQVAEGGSEAVVITSPEGLGAKLSEGAGEALLYVFPEGLGVRFASGGSEAVVVIISEGAGRKFAVCIAANPLAYDGYRWFMEQYIKNKVAGLPPLKLPDGTPWD
jgi:hypothetical protein